MSFDGRLNPDISEAALHRPVLAAAAEMKCSQTSYPNYTTFGHQDDGALHVVNNIYNARR